MGNMKELFESEMVKFGMFEHVCNAMNIDSETGSYSCKDTEAMFAGFKIAMHMVSEKTKIEKFREFECAETSYDYGFIEGFNEAIYRINEVTK